MKNNLTSFLFFMSFPLCLSVPVGDPHLLQHTRPQSSFLPPSFPLSGRERGASDNSATFLSSTTWSDPPVPTSLPIPIRPSAFTQRSRILESMTYIQLCSSQFNRRDHEMIILDNWVNILYIHTSSKQNASPLLISRGVNICKFSMNLCLSFPKASSQF